MKIRMGFVSNSSSSSFVFICDKKIYDNIQGVLHPFVKHLLAYKGVGGSKQLFGKTCVMSMGSHNSEDSYDCIYDYEGDFLTDEKREIKFDTDEWKSYRENSWELMGPLEAMRHVVELANEVEEESAFFQKDY